MVRFLLDKILHSRLWLILFCSLLAASIVELPSLKLSSSISAQTKKKKKKKAKKSKKKKKGKKKKTKKAKSKKKKSKLSKEVREAMRKAKEAKAKKKAATTKGAKTTGAATTTGTTGALDKTKGVTKGATTTGIPGAKDIDNRGKEKKEKIVDLEKQFDDQFEKDLGVEGDVAASNTAGKTGIEDLDKSAKLVNLLSNNRNIVVNVWVGGSKSFFDTSGRLSSGIYCKNVAASAESCSASSTGFSAGADGWFKLLPWLKVGGGVSYMNFGSAQAKFKGNIRDVGIINLDQSFSLSYFTIMPMARYDLSAFYAAVGVAPSVTNFNISNYDSNGTVASDAFSKNNGWAFMTLVGLLIPINQNFSFDVFARIHYFTGQVSRSAFDPINNSTTSTESTSGALVITPGFALSYYL